MERCPQFSPATFIELSNQFAAWEVLATAVVSALTVVASIWLARTTTRAELERTRDADRRQRRSQAYITFTDFCASLIRSFDDESYGAREEISKFESRMNAYVDEDDHKAFEWMRDVVENIVDAASDFIGPAHERVFKRDQELEPEDIRVAIESAGDAGRQILRQRVHDLRDWVRTPLSWDDYLASVDAEPLNPRKPTTPRSHENDVKG